ncbi:cbb3-type cytochrome oxidase assembly protein CcoS [Aliikangiella sp. IMCC44359]|uniref:cbb3-type cytochrome oxidase assembly protein CcoS n=1 Tax=Aliikangiella sp. IMCC44359 TaxID=3459125 RepID=UPI00403B1602
MDVIYWLIPLSIVILIVAVIIFFWAVKSGQFQDLDSAAIEILFDDDTPHSKAPNIDNKTNKQPPPIKHKHSL